MKANYRKAFVGNNVNVKDAVRFPLRGSIEHSAYVGFVRALIGGEPGVAIKPKNRTFRIGAQRDSCLSEQTGSFQDQLGQRLLQIASKGFLTWIEPIAFVVDGQISKKLDGLVGESGEGSITHN